MITWALIGSAVIALVVPSRSDVESAMLMLHSGRPYGTDSSRQRQDHARRPSCYTAIEGFLGQLGGENVHLLDLRRL